MDKEVEEGEGRPVYFCFCGHDCACANLYVCTLVKRAHLIHIKVSVCVFVFVFAWPISLQVCGRAGSSVSNGRGERGQTHLCLLFLLHHCYVSLSLTLLSGCHLKDGATLTFDCPCFCNCGNRMVIIIKIHKRLKLMMHFTTE